MANGITVAEVNKIKEFAENKEYDQAIELIRKQDLTKSLNPQFLRVCGEVMLATGNYNESRHALLLAHNIAPGGNRIIYFLVLLYLEVGEIEKASTYLDIYRYYSSEGDLDKVKLEYEFAKSKKATPFELFDIYKPLLTPDRSDEISYEFMKLYKAKGENESFDAEYSFLNDLYQSSEYLEKAKELKKKRIKDAEDELYRYPESSILESDEELDAYESELLERDKKIIDPGEAQILLMGDEIENLDQLISQSTLNKWAVKRQEKADKRAAKKAEKQKKQEERKAKKEAVEKGELPPEALEENFSDSVDAVKDAVAEKAGLFKKAAKKKASAVKDKVVEKGGELKGAVSEKVSEKVSEIKEKKGTEEKKVEETKTEEVKAEETKVEETKAEEVKPEVEVVEEPAVEEETEVSEVIEEPVVEEEPEVSEVIEEPVVEEEPEVSEVVEEPVVEEEPEVSEVIEEPVVEEEPEVSEVVEEPVVEEEPEVSEVVEEPVVEEEPEISEVVEESVSPSFDDEIAALLAEADAALSGGKRWSDKRNESSEPKVRAPRTEKDKHDEVFDEYDKMLVQGESKLTAKFDKEAEMLREAEALLASIDAGLDDWSSKKKDDLFEAFDRYDEKIEQVVPEDQVSEETDDSELQRMSEESVDAVEASTSEEMGDAETEVLSEEAVSESEETFEVYEEPEIEYQEETVVEVNVPVYDESVTILEPEPDAFEESELESETDVYEESGYEHQTEDYEEPEVETKAEVKPQAEEPEKENLTSTAHSQDVEHKTTHEKKESHSDLRAYTKQRLIVDQVKLDVLQKLKERR